jgi:hypothetical protein
VAEDRQVPGHVGKLFCTTSGPTIASIHGRISRSSSITRSDFWRHRPLFARHSRPRRMPSSTASSSIKEPPHSLWVQASLWSAQASKSPIRTPPLPSGRPAVEILHREAGAFLIPIASPGIVARCWARGGNSDLGVCPRSPNTMAEKTVTRSNPERIMADPPDSIERHSPAPVPGHAGPLAQPPICQPQRRPQPVLASRCRGAQASPIHKPLRGISDRGGMLMRRLAIALAATPSLPAIWDTTRSWKSGSGRRRSTASQRRASAPSRRSTRRSFASSRS